MKGPVECVRCHAIMELGCVIDHTHGGQEQQAWSPGKPRESFWTGLDIDQKQLIPVTTLRCPQCGYLESYANPKSEGAE